MASINTRLLIIVSIITAVGAFYLLTIREGHDWGGDFSMYIHHAKNIAEGIDYDDTGYIHNPFYPSLGPKTYPPIFPLLLAPVYKWFGLNLSAMKIEVIMFFLVFLFVAFLIFRNELPFQYVAAMVAIIGFNPFFWNFKDSVLPEMLFLVFVYLSLFFIHRAYHADKPQSVKLRYAILVGVLIYLAYGTRSIGLALIPSLFIYDIIRARRPSQFTLVATLTFVFLAALQTIFLHSDSSYASRFIFKPKLLTQHLNLYRITLAFIWGNGYSQIFKTAVFVIVSAFAIIGYITRIKDRVTIFEIFPAFYIIIIIVWPGYGGFRFLIPIIPLYIFYAFAGIRRINFTRRRVIENLIASLLTAAILISYTCKYTRVDFGPIREGVGTMEAKELFEYVRENTDKDDVFIFRKPRVLSLFTERSASVYHYTQNDTDLWNYFHKIGASYIILQPLDDQFLYLFVLKYRGNFGAIYGDRLHFKVNGQQHTGVFTEVYSNWKFKVYKIKYDSQEKGL